MAKPSQSRLIVRYFHHIASKPSTTGNQTSTKITHFITTNPKIAQNPARNVHIPPQPNISGLFGKSDPHVKFLPGRSFVGFRHFSTKNYENGSKKFAKNLAKNPGLAVKNTIGRYRQAVGSFLGFRYFSTKNYEKGLKNFANNLAKNPGLAVKNTVGRYRQAIGLQIEAFWKRNYLTVLGAGGIVVCIVLWRVLFGIANTFIGFSEGMAKYGFLALSSAIVAFTGLYLRSKFTINPDKVYRMAMRRLNTSAGILEVMGAPLTGTDLRAYVMSGGGITLKSFHPRLRSKRCFLIFPIRGSERKGLVSVEVKKKKGEYDMKLLAVDIPMASGPDQRLFLIGNEEEYRIGGGLISELRDPVVKALAAAKEFDDQDDKEDEEDAARELEDAERRHQEEVEKANSQ